MGLVFSLEQECTDHLPQCLSGARVRARRAGRHALRGAFAVIAAALLLSPVVGVHAQSAAAAAKAAAEAAAKAKAEAEAEARARAAVFAKYQQEVRELTQNEAKIAKQREASAEADLRMQQQLLQEQVKRRDAAERRSKQLDSEYAANKIHIQEISELLAQHTGNLGELFGVTRQIAGDAAGQLADSMLSTEFKPAAGQEDRTAFMRRIAGAKTLPSIGELRRLWYELQREMTDNGTVRRYSTPVLQLDGTVKNMGVTRVGPFSATVGNRFLGYLPSKEIFAELDGRLAGNYTSLAAKLDSVSAATHPGYVEAVVDPSGGTGGGLLGVYLRRPDWIQRIQDGQVVGYVIIAVGVIALLLALFQYGYLIVTRVAVKKQLRDLSKPTSNNPLGRLFLAYQGIGGDEASTLAELRLSEAVLREVPKLERFQAFLRLAIAAGPLLGLIGTVIGMIITFHAIVASGASDPKLMAKGIGQAMIATVLGLSIAIPLLFVNAGLTLFSRSLTQVLDEHSQALLAENIKSSNGQTDTQEAPEARTQARVRTA
ncbi:MAG TPA: MotA/TolQ/ExbB proton channel family protein [Gammaproteobacteria bacterium]|nr:MotA/TolQ/ExbB proton channel family protein [Gammaproteobacteria bacterium]